MVVNANKRGVAIVTGGRRGIGAAIAIDLARAGFSIALVDAVEDDDSGQTQAAIEQCGVGVASIRGDISDLDKHSELIERSAALGPIACLVNNAGVNMPVRGDMLETSPEVFDRVLNVNLRGTFFLSQAVASHMHQASDPPSHRSIV